MSALVAGGVVGLALPAAPLVAPGLGPAAVASSTYHCSGYDPCKQAGYSDGGYGAVSGRMYWRMYAGHNCTNYVAYRMIKAGMSTERPWSGSGMARNWGLAMANKTDQKPAVGAVAWWAAGDGVGSSGHVAVVEKVISPTSIQISEDSWSGTFHWRTITKTGSGWPTGFIHLADAKAPAPAPQTIVNATAPKVTGEPRVGSQLTATPGTWKTTGTTFAYQWLADGTPIPGATNETFTPARAQNGATLRVQVTASRSGWTSASAVSSPTGKVGEGVLTSSGAPSVQGVGQVGEVLTATSAGWSPQPSMTAFRWRADGKILPKQGGGAELTLTRDMLGKKISVTEIARAPGFAKGEATPSAPVGPVTAGEITTPQPFTASGQARVGASLQITPGTVAPAGASVRYAWLRDGKAIAGQSKPTYQVTAADAGSTIVGQARLSKGNYADVTKTFEFGSVSTASEMTVNAKSKRRAVALGIHLTAPGIGGINGTVTVRIAGQEVRGQVQDGFARVLVPDLRPGDRKVRVVYNGTTGVTGSTATTRVRVAR